MTGKEKVFSEIRKRDGRVVPFEASKITQAIFAAARAVGGEDYNLAEQICDEVIRFLAAQQLPGVIPGVEEIQDVVEKVLIERGHARTAKAYILYRAGRTRIRETRSELMDVVKDILVDDHKEETGLVNSPAGKMQRIALAASQKYYLDNLLPPEGAEAHIQGVFHINQLGYYSKTIDSLQIDLEPLLRKSFGNAEKDISHQIQGILLRLSLILQRSHEDLYGELAIPAFDTVLGKALRNEGMESDSTEFAHLLKDFLAYLRAFYCSSGGYTGGCSIVFGLDTSEEGMTVARTVLLDLCAKKAQDKSPRYIYMLKNGINMAEGDPAYSIYRLALQAALGGANLAFCLPVNSESHRQKDQGLPGYFSSGLRIGESKHGPVTGTGRGNLFSLTLNLPRLALTWGQGDEGLFFVELDRMLRLAVRQLLHRYEVLTDLRCRDLPFVMGSHLYRGSENLASSESIRDSLKKGVMTLCFCGLRETVNILRKEQDQTREEGKRLQSRILDHLFRRVGSFAEEYDLNIALSGTFEQEIARHFVKKDRQDFGLIKEVTDREFYNNGFLLFQEDEGLAAKLELEGELHRYCPAGYLSRVVLVSGLETGETVDFMNRLTAAGINFFQLAAGKDLFGK